jgi:Ca2+-binding EF-hand superfamily protein
MQLAQGLLAKYDTIQMSGKTHQRKAYQPPAGVLTGPGLKAFIKEVTEKEWQFTRVVREYYAAEKKKAEQEYVELVEELDAFMEGKQQEAAAVAGSNLDDAGDKLAALMEEIKDCEVFGKAEKAVERLENNGIPIHAVAGTNKRWDEMCWKLEQVKDYISRKKTFYETEKNVAASQDIPADRLAEFNEIFQTFDTDMSSALQLRDFANCIKGLGIEVDDDELEVLFKKYTVSGKGITFEKFVEFMWQATADTQSKDQVLMSFKTLAHNKECLTSEELQQVIEQLGPNLVEFCSSHMPATDGGFDYVKYITETFE